MKIKLFLIMLGLLLLSGPGRVAAQEATDPLVVIEAYNLALQQGDVQAALDLFADDAVLTTRTEQLAGKEQIRAWLERLVIQNARIDQTNFEVAGDTVTWQTTFFRADLETLANTPLEAETEAVVEEGKIQSFNSILTEEAQARLETAQSAPETEAAEVESETTAAGEEPAASEPAETAPAALPTAGGSHSSTLWLALGFFVVGAGLVSTAVAIKIYH